MTIKSLNCILNNVILLSGGGGEARKNKESKNPKVIKTKNRTAIFLSKCSVCNIKKSKFLKEQQATEFLSN